MENNLRYPEFINPQGMVHGIPYNLPISNIRTFADERTNALYLKQRWADDHQLCDPFFYAFKPHLNYILWKIDRRRDDRESLTTAIITSMAKRTKI